MDEDVDIIWYSTLDGEQFSAEVTRLREYAGRLTVKHIESDETLLDVEVSLSYGAIFGPDVSDVGEWADKTIEVVDKWYTDHGESIPDENSTNP